MATNPRGICKHCGQDRNLIGRGLCNRCHKKLDELGRLDEYPSTRGKKPGSAETAEASPAQIAAVVAVDTPPAAPLDVFAYLVGGKQAVDAPPAATPVHRKPGSAPPKPFDLGVVLEGIAGANVLGDNDPTVTALARCCHYLAQQLFDLGGREAPQRLTNAAKLLG